MSIYEEQFVASLMDELDKLASDASKAAEKFKKEIDKKKKDEEYASVLGDTSKTKGSVLDAKK